MQHHHVAERPEQQQAVGAHTFAQRLFGWATTNAPAGPFNADKFPAWQHDQTADLALDQRVRLSGEW